jgi:nicotinamidase-related amidase
MMFRHPLPDMTITQGNTALVLTDMHNDFLTPGGKAHALIAESLERNDTAANLERLLAAASCCEFPVFVSPHYYYPHDHRWEAPVTALEDLAHQIGLVGRKDPLSLEGFEGSGADFPERYKPYIQNGRTVVTSPHKAYSASTNDLILQLRRRRVDKLILAGPVGNLCVEAHMRDFVEHGFEVAMVRDATAGAKNDEGDGYRAALTNWRFMAHALWTTHEAVSKMEAAVRLPTPSGSGSLVGA